MPPKIADDTSPSSKERENKKSRQEAGPQDLEPGQQPPPNIMTTRTQTFGYPAAYSDMPGSIRLPPLPPLATGRTRLQSLSLSASTSSQGFGQGPHLPPSPYTPTGPPQPYDHFLDIGRALPAHPQPISLASTHSASRSILNEPSIPHKRHYEPSETSHGLLPPLSIPTPASIAPRNINALNTFPTQSVRRTTSSASTPTSTTASLPLPGPISGFSRPASEISSNSITNRCSLHIRQQPRAARAGPDGKDRRNIDPPPVLQLLLQDFDPDSPVDVSELKSNHYVVHCKLISADSTGQDVSTHTTISEDGNREISRLLLGTNVTTPFFCNDDPDIANMPQHPKSELEAPASPSSRFLAPSIRRREQNSTSPMQSPTSEAEGPSSSNPTSTATTSGLPGAFFIFADLSVRRAGTYRLHFTLMKMDPTATLLPMIHIIVSDPFRVVNAKDFDQVHPSTRLVRGLLERGAPFPLKLKKGIREGQRRRTVNEETRSGDGSVEGERGQGGDEDDEGED